ncbi:MAG: hypothetical protein MUD01_02635 [Chloroflexaceae bacterium]|jgi:hypothetical protein|nr:hypothetical protein [Chloroflexaceae bacterium]
MDPLIGFILRHPEELTVKDLQGVVLEVAQDEEQAVFWRWQGTVLVGTVGALRSSLAVQAPHVHMGQKCLLEGWN